jgi:hypothetical protein
LEQVKRQVLLPALRRRCAQTQTIAAIGRLTHSAALRFAPKDRFASPYGAL